RACTKARGHKKNGSIISSTRCSHYLRVPDTSPTIPYFPLGNMALWLKSYRGYVRNSTESSNVTPFRASHSAPCPLCLHSDPVNSQAGGGEIKPGKWGPGDTCAPFLLSISLTQASLAVSFPGFSPQLRRRT